MMWPNVLPEGDTTLRTGVTLSLRTVTPEYFDALRIPLVKGRLFSQSDTDTTNRLGVLNESAARALFADGDPIGRTIASYGTKYQVVGVIADVKMRRLDLAPSPQLYTSYLQMPLGSEAPVTIMVRGRYSDAKLGSVLRNAMASVDSEVQASVATMAQVRWQKTSAERFRTMLSLVFAATAMSLSLIGVFGLVSYAVTQRSREIGIRMAIGANGRSVIRLMTRQSLIPAAVGLIVGTAASLWLSSFLTVFLYEISPTNATTFAVAITVFILSAFLASYFPARRAALIDPWKILRHD
jgi:ABC-type antimicrobial peptide transport system permease subunit